MPSEFPTRAASIPNRVLEPPRNRTRGEGTASAIVRFKEIDSPIQYSAGMGAGTYKQTEKCTAR